MAGVYTVSQINSYIKHMFEEDFALNHIGIKGEVSNCKYHPSGHIYFSLKDGGGVLSCVMFAGNRGGLSFPMKEGQKVVVFGKVTVYERDGKYQMYAKEITLDGEGDLYRKYEKLKQELEEMGMFADEYKKDIPRYAQRIGIVTAETGAAVQDIIQIARRRNPYVELILYPAIVQGKEAPASIVNGIRCLDRMNLDVLIVGRGGGSIEDLWAFNEEIVAREIFECQTPVISAVGHETDTTIADFVADLRAPTPSAAAELAVFEYSSLVQDIERYRYELRRKMNKNLEQAQNYLQYCSVRLKSKSPENLLLNRTQYLADMEIRLRGKMEAMLTANKHRLAMLEERLNGVSPFNKLSKGYAFLEDEEGRAVKSVAQAPIGTVLTIRLADGTLSAKVTDIGRKE